MAEWLGSALQKLLQRFESASDLQTFLRIPPSRWDFLFCDGMKRFYLLLSIAGFTAPNIYTAKVSIEAGNWLFWLDPTATVNGIFANDTSTAFVIDLIFVVTVFFIWSYREAQRLNMKKVWVYWLLTILFGLAGTLPLFLWVRESKLQTDSSTKA
jgi:hypothetical protein